MLLKSDFESGVNFVQRRIKDSKIIFSFSERTNQESTFQIIRLWRKKDVITMILLSQIFTVDIIFQLIFYI